MWNTSICSQRRVHKLTVEASFECFRFFRSENLKIWKSWRRHFSSENLKIWKIAAADCANWKSEITSRFSVFQIGMILIANLKNFFRFSVFQMTMFESNLKIDVTNLKPHASRTHLKIWRVRDSNMLFWSSENTPIFWTSDFQIWRIWSTQTRP